MIDLSTFTRVTAGTFLSLSIFGGSDPSFGCLIFFRISAKKVGSKQKIHVEPKFLMFFGMFRLSHFLNGHFKGISPQNMVKNMVQCEAPKIAKLVPITPISLWFMVLITIVFLGRI